MIGKAVRYSGKYGCCDMYVRNVVKKSAVYSASKRPPTGGSSPALRKSLRLNSAPVSFAFALSPPAIAPTRYGHWTVCGFELSLSMTFTWSDTGGGTISATRFLGLENADSVRECGVANRSTPPEI